MSKAKPMKPSEQCVRDAASVLEHYPDAEAHFDRANNVVRILDKITSTGATDTETQLGFGCSAESAWADARSNVVRKTLPRNHEGSPTWSLKSDEQYWMNKEHAKTVRKAHVSAG